MDVRIEEKTYDVTKTIPIYIFPNIPIPTAETRKTGLGLFTKSISRWLSALDIFLFTYISFKYLAALGNPIVNPTIILVAPYILVLNILDKMYTNLEFDMYE